MALEGLKAIGCELERLAAARGIVLRATGEVVVWKLIRRAHDPLPAYKTRGTKGGRRCDPEALAAWFSRQKFALVVTDGPFPAG